MFLRLGGNDYQIIATKKTQAKTDRCADHSDPFFHSSFDHAEELQKTHTDNMCDSFIISIGSVFIFCACRNIINADNDV